VDGYDSIIRGDWQISIPEPTGIADGAPTAVSVFGDGLKPIVIGLAESDGGVQPVVTRSLDLAGIASPMELGGLIELQPILAIRGSGTEETTSEKLAAAAPTESSPALRMTATMATTSSISSEWARAIMFETAGGEPSAAGLGSSIEGRALRPANGGAAIPQTRSTSSYYNPAASAAVVRTASYSRQAAADAEDARTAESLSDGSIGGLPAEFASLALDGGELANDHASVAAAAGHERDAAHDANAAALYDAAYAAAFEQFSEGKQAALASSDSASTRKTFGAASILMVLALERISSRNSRRPTADASAVAIERPRRRPVAAGIDERG
jgi:hypothetical protein